MQLVGGEKASGKLEAIHLAEPSTKLQLLRQKEKEPNRKLEGVRFAKASTEM